MDISTDMALLLSSLVFYFGTTLSLLSISLQSPQLWHYLQPFSLVSTFSLICLYSPVCVCDPPFYANKGYHPNLAVHPEWDLALAWAWEFVINLNKLHQHLRENMAAAQLWYQGTANALQLPALEFLIGSWGFVKVQFFHTTRPSKKLADKFLGPYEVIAQPSTHLITL